MQTAFYIGNKYERCARWLREQAGTLLDIGSRDRVLLRYLDGSSLHYVSADLAGSQHDHIVNLEQLMPFADRAFDVVVALDVLEHVDRAHQAIDELFRVATREVLIALPNLSSWQHRMSYLRHGRFASDKYDMLSQAVPDRHRWLPSWPYMQAFVEGRSKAAGFSIQETALEAETPGKWSRMAMLAYLGTGLPTTPAMVRRAIWRCVRIEEDQLCAPKS